MRSTSFVAVLVFAMPTSALGAAGEAQLGLDLGGGLGLSEGAPVLSSELNLWVGINEWIWFSGAAGVVHAPSLNRHGAQMLLGASVALDVVTWMPWAQAMLGSAIDDRGHLFPVGRLALGLDRWLTFQWAVGAWVRGQPGLPSRLGGPHVAGGVRALWRWDL